MTASMFDSFFFEHSVIKKNIYEKVIREEDLAIQMSKMGCCKAFNIRIPHPPSPSHLTITSLAYNPSGLKILVNNSTVNNSVGHPK